MEQERRKTQGVAQSADTSPSLREDYGAVPYTDWIANMAKHHRNERLVNLTRHFSVANFVHAYAELEGSKAVGNDGITKERYGVNLKENLENLHTRMKKLAYLYNHIKDNRYPWVVDVDLKSFFDSIDHKTLIEILSLRINDKTFLRYMVRLLKAEILVEAASKTPEQGTPQGSIVSPILANAFLHHVLDDWFVQTIKPQRKSEMVRYADDFVVTMKTEAEAKEFVERLKMRLAEYGLSLNEDKSRILCFDQDKPKERGTFDFLGFTFYWGKGITGTVLKVRTGRKTLVKKVLDFEQWIKANRSRYPIDRLWEKVSQKLQGHYQYFGVSWNRWKLLHFYHKAVWKLFQWINRRSQKISYTWEGFKMRLQCIPLPVPKAASKLVQLTNPRWYCV